MKIVKYVLQLLLIAQFGFFGISKIIGTPDMVEAFTAFGFPMWFMVLTGLIEITAVASLVTGFFKPQAVYLGAFLIAGLTVGATLSHALLEGNMANAAIPLVVFVQNGVMAWLHRQVSEEPVLQARLA